MRIKSLVGLAAVFLSALSNAEPPDLAGKVRQIVTEELATSKAPAISVAVVADGRIVASEALGYADLESKTPVARETVFQTASLTKLLTAALVMHEVEKGSVTLDASVNDTLPAGRQVRNKDGSAVSVTLRQLLSHNAGLPFHSSLQLNPSKAPLSLDEALSYGLVTIRKPGDKLIYASDGFGLAGWLLARAEQKSFDELASEVLLTPLGMEHSNFRSPWGYGPALASAHDGGKRVLQADVTAGMPSGALNSTADDLAKFALLCLGRGEYNGVRILKAESVEEMMQLRARAHPRLPEGFGLGFAVRETPGRRMAWWDGQLPGAASRLALLPEHNVGVVVLANASDNNAVARIANRILELLVPNPVRASTSPDIEAAERGIVGTYRLKDMLPFPRSLAERFVNFKITKTSDGLKLSSLLFDSDNRVTALGDGMFRVEGGMLDGSTGIVTDDTLFFSVLEGSRVGQLGSATAWFIYAGAAALTLLTVTGWGLVRLISRKR